MIELKNVDYVYNAGTKQAVYALKDVSFQVEDGSFTAVIGHTGSGKSTLIAHLNGMLAPTKGQVLVDGVDLADPKVKLRQVRQKVGLVFQYPEHQLFEETIYKDIAFGPKNQGLSEADIQVRVQDAMTAVGLDYEKYKDRSPFALSGGQKRRVAIAGVIAMDPKYLVLDEPVAGLDPRGRDDLLDELVKLQKDKGLTIVLISHSMEDVARCADQVIVMDQGQVYRQGPVRAIFSDQEALKAVGLDIPQITQFLNAYQAAGHPIQTDALTVEEAARIILNYKGVDHV